MKVAVHPLVDDYISALDDAARRLPRKDREELVGQIIEHIDAALPAEPTEAAVRNLLDALGSPQDIVAAAGGTTAPAKRGAREAFALVLLVTGLPPVVGWAVGLGLLLWSPLWSARQKLLGALVWPGGFVGAFLFFFALPVGQSAVTLCSGGPGVTSVCRSAHTGPPGWVAAVVAGLCLVGPLLMATHLWREAGRRSAV